MAFKRLHEGLDHNCLEQTGIKDDFENYYVRGVPRRYVCVSHFDSKYEREDVPNYPLNTKKANCMWRCVSVNLLGEDLNGDRAELQQHYDRISGLAPKAEFAFLCIFKMSKDTAKVWDTATDKNPTHYSLIKADEFDLGDIEIADVIRLEDF